MRRMDSLRPMTHELFALVLARVRIDVIAVRLIGRDQGNYLAELDLMAPNGRERIAAAPLMAWCWPADARAGADPGRRAAAGGLATSCPEADRSSSRRPRLSGSAP